jgi:hypothetical protein
VLKEVGIPIREVPVHRGLRIVQGFVIAVMNDRLSHAAEHRLDHVEELGA